MDLSPFGPGYDLAGKRARSLELYGLGSAFRHGDGFGVELDEIVRCAARFTGATGASIDVWSDAHPENLAACNLVPPGPATPTVPVDAVLARVWAGAPETADPFTVGPARDEPADVTCWAVPLVGQEQVALGLLTAWHPGAWEPAPDQRSLLSHLAGAAIGVMDRQRRVRLRRARPGQPPLRSVDAPDRRRDGC